MMSSRSLWLICWRRCTSLCASAVDGPGIAPPVDEARGVPRAGAARLLRVALACQVAQDDLVQALLGDQVFAEEGLHADFVDPRLLLQLAGGQHLRREGGRGGGALAGAAAGAPRVLFVAQLPGLVVLGAAAGVDVVVDPVDQV